MRYKTSLTAAAVVLAGPVSGHHSDAALEMVPFNCDLEATRRFVPR